MKRYLNIVLLSLLVLPLMAQPKREFRASWLTTVWAIDWPTSWGQTSASGQQKQQDELKALVDSLSVANMNAVFFQVRSFCDAMYNSKYEPWSKYLTGTRGGEPMYDPLALLVSYAHSKGIEVHAWMNPYRYSTSDDTYGKLATDYSNTHPEWLVSCGGYHILNPCMPEVKERIAAVVADLVQHYDVDGVIFDDYFYQSGYQNSYEDSYYAATGGGMSRADWRREQVNDMVRMVRDTIHATKPWVAFGIGPAGIAGKGNTSAPVYGVEPCPVGSDWQYNGIYSDPLAWYDRGLIDYMAPQCYWPRGAGNDYTQLSNWWSYIAGHFNRHVYISQDLSGLVAPTATPTSGKYHADEIAAQMQLDRDYDLMGAPGSCWYSLKSGINTKDFIRHIRAYANPRPAVVPMKSWRRTDDMLFVSNIIDKNNQLTWTPPADNLRYAVYAIPADSVGYPGIVGSSRYLLGTTYSPLWPYQASADKTYAIAVLDRYGNEFPARTKGNTTLGVSAAVQTMFPATGASVLMPCWFSWQPVDKADSYFFQLSKHADFSTVDYECETVEPTFFSGRIEWLQHDTTYYWRVRTRSINRTDTYSAVQSFSVSYFHLAYPVDGQKDCPVQMTFVADSVPSQSATYHFEVGTSDLFTASTLVWQADASVPRVTMPDSVLLYSSYYYVRCVVSYEGLTAISPAVRFRTEAQEVPVPVITSPKEGETIVGTDIEICWQQQPSSGFRIELSTAENFASRKTKIATQSYDAFCYTYTDREPGVYYVRVRAIADAGWTEPSQPVSFTLEAPSAVGQTNVTDLPVKVIRNGQLLIRVKDTWFDIFGCQINM